MELEQKSFCLTRTFEIKNAEMQKEKVLITFIHVNNRFTNITMNRFIIAIVARKLFNMVGI